MIFGAIRSLSVYYYLLPTSSSNGVKEMDGFREFFNLSRSEVNSTVTCSSEESSEETSAILVSISLYYALIAALLIEGVNCI